MENSESLAAFYQRKFDWIPEHLRHGLGHFNVFRLEPLTDDKARTIPYKRRDFYKVMFIRGHSRVHYADRVAEVKKQALSFSNPQIPYRWEQLDHVMEGFFCIFNRYFFREYENLNQYSVFQPSGEHIFELTDEQAAHVTPVFERMFEEIASDYIHKYDVLRNLVSELVHFAMKMQPALRYDRQSANASHRIASLFMELLERQFPIEDTHPHVLLRSASDFAGQLNIHVNHLNRAVKEVTQRTTTQIIAERMLQEAKILLKHSRWNVTEIAFALGFTEVTYFNSFFKKHTGFSPLQFRKEMNAI